MSAHTAIAIKTKGVIEVPSEEPRDSRGRGYAESRIILPEVYMVGRGMFIESYPCITSAGTVTKVGSNVKDIKPNDRVQLTTFAYGPSRYKGMQQYANQNRSVCAKISDSLSFEAAATIPDNFPPLADTPILIYGAGATAGQYMIRLLRLAHYKNIIVTASSAHHEYLHSLGATHVFDYHSSTLMEDLSRAAGGPNKLTIAVDCISSVNTMRIIKDVLNPTGTVALLMPVKEGISLNVDEGKEMVSDLPLPAKLNPFGKETNIIGVKTFFHQTDPVLKEKLMPVILPELLEKGLIGATPYRVLDQGNLKQRAEQALELHRTGQVHGEKIVVKIY